MSEDYERTVEGVVERARMVPGTDLELHKFPVSTGPLSDIPWIDGTGGELADAMRTDDARRRNMVREVAAAISSWSEDSTLGAARAGAYSVFDRNAYVAPQDVFAQMTMARRAVEDDDVVGGAADTTEALAISGVHFESDEMDEANVFNQWAEQVDLEEHFRTVWREVFTDSQSVVAMWWGARDLEVEGRMPPKVEILPDGTTKVTLGNARRKKYESVYCPIALTTLDSTRVVPVGSFAFGQEMLCWIATAEEMQAYRKQFEAKDITDSLMARLFVRPYDPTPEEVRRLRAAKVNPEALILLNPACVWRYTRTRASYKPWSDVRLKRVFRFLDIKQQLINADRTALIGNANYILVITKGDKDRPASTTDLEKLNASFQYIAKLPVMIGDDTLTVSIVAPKTDFTLQEDRYGVVQMQILHSVYQTFRAEGAGSSRSDTTFTVGRAIARGLASLRESIATAHYMNVVKRIVDHPLNDGKFKTDPQIAFTPRNIALETDQATWQAMTAAHAAGDVSRRSFLEEMGLDIEVEAARRLEEDEYYDAIFKTATPFNAPGNNPFGPGGTGGPGNDGGGALPPGAGGGGGRPPGKPVAKKTATVPAKKAVAPAKAAPVKKTTPAKKAPAKKVATRA